MNQIDAGRIEIKEWVIHDIPQSVKAGESEGSSLNLSEVLSPFDGEVARFFEQKISENLAKSCHPVVAIEGASVPAQMLDHLQDNRDLMTLSISLATRLHETQTGAMSAGLLVAMRGDYEGSKPLLAVLKLEKERGARAQQEQLEGKSTYSVQYLKDLFLTNRTRVFKVGVFLGGESEMSGWITDPQSRGVGVARFFLNEFLECELVHDPRMATAAFHVAAETFINSKIEDPTTKARYETAVLAELQSNSTEVNISDFARRSLDVQDRDKFVHSMKDADVADIFVKDISDISGKINQVQYQFEGGVRVNVPVESSETIDIRSTVNGQTQLQVTDTLQKVKSLR